MSSLPPETVLRFLMWRTTDNSLRPCWRFLALIGLPPLLALAQTAIWIADAHRGDGKRFVVRADERLTAFLEL
jgi:hypothetical protein